MKKIIIILLSLINLQKSQLLKSPPPLTEEDLMLMEELRKINPKDPILLELEKELQNQKNPNLSDKSKSPAENPSKIPSSNENPLLGITNNNKNNNNNNNNSNNNNNNFNNNNNNNFNNNQNNSNNNNNNFNNNQNNNQNNNNQNNNFNNNQNNNNQNNNFNNNQNNNNFNNNQNLDDDNMPSGPEYPFPTTPTSPEGLMLSLITGQGDAFSSPQNTQNFVTLFSDYLRFLNSLEKNEWNLKSGLKIDSCTALAKMSPIGQIKENLRICVPMHIYSSKNFVTCFVWACVDGFNATFFYRICTRTIPFDMSVLNLDYFGMDMRVFEKNVNPQVFMQDTWFAIDRILDCRNPKDLMKGLKIVEFFGGDITWND